MAKEDEIEFVGVIKDMPGSGLMKVVVTRNDGSTHEVLARLSGKMQQHKIKCVVGDRVKVSVSPYDLTKGRITFRERG